MNPNPLLPTPPPLDYVSRVYANLTMILMIPVSITVFIVVWGVQVLTPIYAGKNQSPVYLAADEASASSPSQKLQASAINALVIVAMVTVITFLMVLLYKLRCMKVIVAWFVISAGMIFFMLAWVWCDLVCAKYQIPYDYLGMAFFIWNFGVVGIIALFYYAPPKMLQAYLVALSVIMGWLMTRLPEWSTWAILLAVACYDIVAVLLPHGPLQMLVRESQARNEPIPGFVYDSDNANVIQNTPQRSSTSIRPDAATTHPEPQRARTAESAAVPASTRSSPDYGSTTPRNQTPRDTLIASAPSNVQVQQPVAPTQRMEEEKPDEEEDEDPFECAHLAHPFKLGLGDFIFYSLLVGRASQTSYVSWMTCYICVINGLVGTLMCLLFLRGKVPALPALPISIFTGVAAFFITTYSTVPYNYYLGLASITV